MAIVDKPDYLDDYENAIEQVNLDKRQAVTFRQRCQYMDKVTKDPDTRHRWRNILYAIHRRGIVPSPARLRGRKAGKEVLSSAPARKRGGLSPRSSEAFAISRANPRGRPSRTSSTLAAGQNAGYVGYVQPEAVSSHLLAAGGVWPTDL